MKKWKIILNLVLLSIGFVGSSVGIFAQVGGVCNSDIDCVGGGLQCVNNICVESSEIPGAGACYIRASNTCSQTETNCSQPNQPFDTLTQCNSFKESQTPQNTADSNMPAIGCREGQDCVSLTNPLATTDIKAIMGNTIQIVMGIAGSITFVVFLYGGVLWLTSAGNSEKIQKGLQAMLWAGIGIIVIFSSYAIITLILDTLQASP